MIELRVDLSPGWSWKRFLSDAPPFSIALDGFVPEAPMFDPEGPRANFNHHDGVSRMETRSTCAQVLIHIRKGLFRCFRDDRGPRAVVWVNDCDEDVCTAWALLNNHALAESAINPLLNKLVQMEDMLDTTAGAYPYPQDLPALRQLAWIYQPYRQFRLDGGLARRNPAAFESVITDVESRIKLYVTGQGKEIPIDTRYEVLGGGDTWALVREIGAQARIGMLTRGIRAYMSIRDRPDGSRTVTIGKLDPYHPADLVRLAERLNAEEHNPGDLWGGGTDVLGSPRSSGTRRTEAELVALMNEACAPSSRVRSLAC